MQSNETGRARKSGTLIGIGAGIAMLAMSSAAQAQDASPLLAMKGTWNGTGNITLSDGNKERIRCRSNYNPDGAGASMQLSLTCASDSYKFELASQVQYRNGQITGNWTETTRAQAGQLTGTASAGRVEVRAEGQTFAAFLNINTRGEQQSISIRSPGSAMQEVAISLNRQK